MKRNEIELKDPQLLELFATVNTVVKQLGLDYFLIGAVARDYRLSAHPRYAAKRKTFDIDLAVVIDSEEQFDQIKNALQDTGLFKVIGRNPVKLLFKGSIEVDILPFGEIENDDRQLRLKKGIVTMDMTGFSEIYPHLETIAISQNVALKICPLEGLVLLKLIASDDDPDRTKDIIDIEHLITAYFELSDEDIYENYYDAMSQYSDRQLNYLHLIGARVIGRKMKVLLQETQGGIENLQRILSRRPTALWQAMLDGLND